MGPALPSHRNWKWHLWHRRCRRDSIVSISGIPPTMRCSISACVLRHWFEFCQQFHSSTTSEKVERGADWPSHWAIRAGSGGKFNCCQSDIAKLELADGCLRSFSISFSVGIVLSSGKPQVHFAMSCWIILNITGIFPLFTDFTCFNTLHFTNITNRVCRNMYKWS